MSEKPKTWREVELRREYLRGYCVAWDEATDESGVATLAMTARSEFASLEALKPCDVCGGDGERDGKVCPYCQQGIIHSRKGTAP